MAGLNSTRFFAKAHDFELQVGNIADALDDMPGFYGFEPGLTDLTGQSAALRAGIGSNIGNTVGDLGFRVNF